MFKLGDVIEEIQAGFRFPKGAQYRVIEVRADLIGVERVGVPTERWSLSSHHIPEFRLSGQSQGNPQQTLRNRLIAEIQQNRMNAGKLGHVGVRPVSDSDLFVLRNMSIEDLEQTAKLTRQLRIPVVGQSQSYKGGRPHKFLYVTYYELPNGKWEVPQSRMQNIAYAIFNTEEEARNYIGRTATR